MLEYTIVHHVPGRVRIHVPVLRGLAITTLQKLAGMPIPSGIKQVLPNPFTGSVVIHYDPCSIDIVGYLKELAASDVIREAVRAGRS